MGGPGVQRSTRFVHHLREFGFEPVVLTINEEDIAASGSNIDSSLFDYIPPGTNIIRVPSAIPLKLNRFLNSIRLFRLFWVFLYPFFWERSAMWPFRTYKTAARIIRENSISTVYTSSGPFSSLILGHLLKKRLGVTWVADMRDPFTDAYAWSYPSKLHWHVCRFFEKKFLRKASHIIVNTPEVKKLYILRGLNENITVITNGY
jgi:hypothetical protein